MRRPRNVLAKVSASDQTAVKAHYWRIFDNITAEPGAAAVAQANHGRHADGTGAVDDRVRRGADGGYEGA